MQLALLSAYFTAYFSEGKDIGNLDLLGDVAQSVGVMSKAAVGVINPDVIFQCPDC